MDHALPINRRILSPTDISQFLRLERCERFLRLRMYEREHGRDFLYDYDVAPEEIPPILGRVGAEFEKTIVGKLAGVLPVTDYSATAIQLNGRRQPDNDRLAQAAADLAPGTSCLIAQPRLLMPLGKFQVRGDADLILFSRDTAGKLSALVIDIKSSVGVKVEHRLQVAFYALMIAQLLPTGTPMGTGILYRGPALGGTAEETDELKQDRAEMAVLFPGVPGFLERIPDPETYAAEVESLVSGNNPVAERVATKSATDLVFALGLKCDGCLFNEYCMRKAHQDEDLSLLPYLTVRDKKSLWRGGVHTIGALAELKVLNTDADGKRLSLDTAPGQEKKVQALAATAVGARVDELVLRAKRRRKETGVPPFIPNKGHTSLPTSTPELHPNLVRVYIEAQNDFTQDRIYLLGALVVANVDGIPVRRRHIVHMTDGPPDGPQKEAALFGDWIVETLRAVVELAEGDSAPIHLIFWNDAGQRALLNALARNLPPMVAAAPALYDFVTQLAAFDSPVATFLSEEIRQHQNYPHTCQSLPILARHLGFEWADAATGDLYTRLFRRHLFDGTGRLDDGTFYEKRARHSSQIPLEYAYGAWDELPLPPIKGEDPFRDYRDVTPDQIQGFCRRRLDAVEHIASKLRSSDIIRKASFDLPDLARFTDRARNLAEAIREFLTIERHTYLADWRSVRELAPERRALLGETLLVSYHDADQEDGGALMRECRERKRLREEWEAANPGTKISGQIKDHTDWSLDGETIRLRVESDGTDADLNTLLGLMTAKEGDWLTCCPRWATYGQPNPYTPTPKQLLYGMRLSLDKVQIQRDTDGKATSATILVSTRFSPKGNNGYYFFGAVRPFEDGTTYTLDENPTDFMGASMKKLADALAEKEVDGTSSDHTFYSRLARADLTTPATWPAEAAAGQARFLAGLDTLHAAKIAYAFEESKRSYIGGHGGDPLLLVQGPPGTGKSFSTGFAVLARIQGAMAAGIPQRVYLSCKTHSATDVLLKGIREAQETLATWRTQAPELFAEYFDPRLLTVPTFRLGDRSDGRDGDKPPADAYVCIAGTPNAISKQAPKKTFGGNSCDLLVLDEASQMSLPESLLASLLLAPGGRVVVVGDPRQMPPIVHHSWDQEPRRTFQIYPTYLSLFDFLLSLKPPLIQFSESFRLHQTMAEFLREEIYQQDGIRYHSRRTKTLDLFPGDDPLTAAALHPDFPLVVIIHDEAESQTRNAFEEQLVGPLLRSLADAHGLDPRHGFGVVVPHRAQRLALTQAHPQLCVLDDGGQITFAAVDTVERYQGDEREVVIISATESDPDYIQASAGFLLDPRRLTVALSRAKQKMILIASRSIFEYASTDDQTFANARIWKNLLRRACTTELYSGTIDSRPVGVYGCPIKVGNDSNG